jgi:hypothetical protein
LQNILRSTCGIIFMGTPHNGAGIARWAEILAESIGLLKQTNPRLVKALKSDSKVLTRIQQGFYTMIRARNEEGLQPIPITCFFEELPLPGLGFVSLIHCLIHIPVPMHALIFCCDLLLEPVWLLVGPTG